MPFYGKRRAYPKKRGNLRKKRQTKRRGVSAPVKSYIKRTLHANIENKTHCKYSFGNPITSYSQNPSLLVNSIIPYATMTQGSHQGQRLGNEIRTRKAMFNYTIYANKYVAGTNPVPTPVEVLIFIGKVKNSKPLVPINTDFQKLFQEGSGSSAPQSNLTDCLMAVNKDWFQCYKIIRHKIGWSFTNQYGYWNNDYKINVIRKVDCTKFCPKILKFNDASSQPTNDGLYFWAMCVNADGTLASQQPAFMDYVMDYTYEDA